MDGVRKFQATLTGEKAELLEGYERPTFTEEGYAFCKDANKVPMKDLNYFYIDFYGKEEEFKGLLEIIKKHRGMKGPHSMDCKVFAMAVQRLEDEI